MKKTLIGLLTLIFLFYSTPVFSEVQQNVPSVEDDKTLKDNLITENTLITDMEKTNVENVQKIIEKYEDILSTMDIRYVGLNSTIKELLRQKLAQYINFYDGITEDTLLDINLDLRDEFFYNRYFSQTNIDQALDILDNYNNLSLHVQGLVTLLNTVGSYVADSEVINQNEFDSQENNLNSYINTVNNKIQDLYNIILLFESNNPDSFASFNNLATTYQSDLNVSKVSYVDIANQMVDFTVQVIRDVEKAYNGNSSISASPEIVFLGDSSRNSCVVEVVVRDSLNNPINDRRVSLFQNNDGQLNFLMNDNTNNEGEVSFSLFGSQEGYVSLVATIEGEDMKLLGTNIIEVTSIQAEGCEESEGTWNGDTCSCPSGYLWEEENLSCEEPQSVDIEKSTIIAEPSKIYTDSEENNSSNITVTLRNQFNNPLIGKEVKLETTFEIFQPGSLTGFTNDNGQVSFQVQILEEGVADLTAIILEDNLQLSVSIIVTNRFIEACQDSSGTWDWNEDTCACKEGYAWVEEKPACLSLAQIGCEGSGGTWDKGENTCICQKGFVWVEEELQCISLAQIGCEGSGGTWVSEIGESQVGDNTGICNCPISYVWVEGKLQCLSLMQIECEKGDGTWDPKTSTCTCKDPNLVWNPIIKKCEVSSGGPTQEECEKGDGTWDPKTSTCTCKDPNFVWNPIIKKCEK